MTRGSCHWEMACKEPTDAYYCARHAEMARRVIIRTLGDRARASAHWRTGDEVWLAEEATWRQKVTTRVATT